VGDIGGLKPGNRRKLAIQMITVTGKVQSRMTSPSVRRRAIIDSFRLFD
jgi:hypothetical protein